MTDLTKLVESGTAGANEGTPLLQRCTRVEHTYEKFYQPCIAELVGVMFFVFVGTMAVYGAGILGLQFVVASAHGLTIAILIAGLGHISGGHFNPAVTLGVTLAGGMSPILATCYVVSQLIGGILGAACCRGVLSFNTTNGATPPTAYESILGGAHDIGTNVGPGQAYLCELLLTAMLVLTVLMTAVDTKGKNVLAPMAIGLVVLVDILAGHNTSGASMNPARSFGPAVVISYYNTAIWDYHYIYWIGPGTGALFAAILYRLFLGASDKRLILKED